MKTLFEEIKQQIWILIKNKILNSEIKEKKKSFYEIYINKNFNQILDINLMMITSFIGIILMQYKGFRFTTFFVVFFNSIAIYLLTIFDFLDNNGEAEFLQIIFLIGLYLIMLISTGGSALLSHQIIIDGLRKYSELKDIMKEEEDNKINNNNNINDINTINNINDINIEIEKKNIIKEEEKIERNDINDINKEKDINSEIENVPEKGKKNKIQKPKKSDYLIVVFITTIFAYFFKMLINYYVIIDPSGIFKNDLKAEHFQLFIYCILFMYIIPTIISLFLYLLYIIVFKKNNITENENERKVRIIDFFGYLIYIEQKKNQTEKMKCELCQRLYYNLYTCTKKLCDELFDYCCCCLDWLYGDCHCCCFDYIDCNCCNC